MFTGLVQAVGRVERRGRALQDVARNARAFGRASGPDRGEALAVTIGRRGAAAYECSCEAPRMLRVDVYGFCG